MRDTSKSAKSRAGERGVALVEFALIAPLLVLLLIGMLDLGKAFNYWIDNTHLANMGARLAVVNYHPASGSLQAYIKAQADSGELKNGGTVNVPNSLSVCITYPGSGAVVGQPVQVNVATTYHWLPILSTKIGILQTTIRGQAIMRLENIPTFSSTQLNQGGC